VPKPTAGKPAYLMTLRTVTLSMRTAGRVVDGGRMGRCVTCIVRSGADDVGPIAAQPFCTSTV
jgi:hypothetical protein